MPFAADNTENQHIVFVSGLSTYNWHIFCLHRPLYPDWSFVRRREKTPGTPVLLAASVPLTIALNNPLEICVGGLDEKHVFVFLQTLEAQSSPRCCIDLPEFLASTPFAQVFMC